MELRIEDLRELTEHEKEELANLDDTGSVDTMQALLGIMANDLAEDESEEYSFSNLCSKIELVYPCEEHPSLGYPNKGPASILGVMDQWIRVCMSYKKKGLVKDLDPKLRGMESSIRAIVFGFSKQIFGISHGYVGKKQGEIMTYYQLVDEDLRRNGQLGLDVSKENLYRYILTCLEYLGFVKVIRPIKMKQIPIARISEDEIG